MGTTHAVRVLELSSDVGGAYCGWLLANLGADVVRVPPAGSAYRAEGSPIALALEYLALGKRTAALAEVDLALCDILICDDADLIERATGESVASLARTFPRLIIGVCSTFGLVGPNARQPAVGIDAQAVSAVAWSLGEPDREPLSLSPGVLEHQSGTNLAAACLLALLVREDRGTGRVVDVALADVLASYVAGNCRIYTNYGLKWQRAGRRAYASGGAYPYVVLPCKDGEVCLCGRTRDEWERLVEAMGRPAWSQEPRYQDLRAMGKQYPEEVDALVIPWLARHTMAEIEALASRHNLVVSPIRAFADVLSTPQFSQRGFWRRTRLHGKEVLGPGLPFRVLDDRAPDAEDRAATMLAVRHEPHAAGKPSGAIDKPLAGLRVLDLGWVWSAPWVGGILAEFGARVIKVEHGGRPDNTRLAGRPIRNGQKVEGPTKEMSSMFHQINHGKLGITLNAKEPRAVELLKRLAADSDVVIENMSPGAMDRAGLGYDALRAVNPRIVYLSMAAAGQFGPLAQMRTYAPVMSSFVGLEALIGYRREPPIGSLNFAIGDPNASVHGLVALFAALSHTRRTGVGCYIDLSQIEAMLATLGPYVLSAQAAGRQPAPLGNAHPDMAPHGIYPAREPDTWLTVAVQDDRRWRALAALAGEPWMDDARFASAEGRVARVDEIDAALRRWTATFPRDELVARLRSAGIASSPVSTIDEQWADANYAARAVKKRVQIPYYGEDDLFKAPWHFSDMSAVIDGSGPTLGQHNREVFCGMLGLSETEFAELAESGVIS
ncbi:MAG TPA: CoA transferase [Casimicrobiaceae bacterium]|nr:CoA transferase [Casimicrobiaceae bacterium]